MLPAIFFLLFLFVKNCSEKVIFSCRELVGVDYKVYSKADNYLFIFLVFDLSSKLQ